MAKYTYPWKSIIPLSLVIIIDALGLTIVFPVFSQLFSNHVNIFLSHTALGATRDLYFSLTILMYPLFMFFGAPIFGDLSDSIGRKKVLLICLIGSLVGFIIAAIAIHSKLFLVLLIGRAISGFTAGSQPIAQAAIVDVSDSKNMTLNMAIIVLAITVGMVLGPIFGGFFSHLNYDMPLWIAALLSLINIVWLLLAFNETSSFKQKKIHIFHGIKLFFKGFSDQRIRSIVFFFLFFQLGWMLYYQVISLFLTNQLGFNALWSGYFMAYLAVFLSLSLSYLIKIVLKHFSVYKIILYSSITVGLGYFISGLYVYSHVTPWICGMLIALANPLVFTNCLTLFSKSVDKNAQGWIMGMTGSINAFALAITAALSGSLSYISPRLPFMTCGIFIVIAICILIFYMTNIKYTDQST